MVKRSGLGRGLSNLIPGAADEGAVGVSESTSGESREYRELAIEKIEPDPEQPRKIFSQQEIDELASTLKSVGLIEPIVVRVIDGDRYRLISGERRWRAAQVAGFKRLPAVIKSVDSLTALEMALIENIQRQDLTPLEEARAYETWIEASGQKATQLAEKIGRDRTTVSNLLRLLKLPHEVQQLIDQRMISAGQARPLLALADSRLVVQLAGKIVREGWSARRVEDEVSRLQEERGAKIISPDSKKDANVKRLEEKLQKQLSAKVELQHRNSGGGKVSIHYGNLDDLDRILSLIGVKS